MSQINIANKLFLEKKFENAIRIYDEILQEEPNNLIALKLISSKLPIGVEIMYKHPLTTLNFRSSLLNFSNRLPLNLV